MQTNAYALDERSIAFVGRYIESFDRNQSRATHEPSSSSAGKLSYEDSCSSCHGESGEGDRSQRATPLINQQDWYLLRQWQKFSSEQRHHYDGSDTVEIDQAELEDTVSWIAGLP